MLFQSQKTRPSQTTPLCIPGDRLFVWTSAKRKKMCSREIRPTNVAEGMRGSEGGLQGLMAKDPDINGFQDVHVNLDIIGEKRTQIWR
jgi:hypothetical protein